VRCQQIKAKSRRKTAFLFSTISALTINSAHRIAIDPGNAILQTLPNVLLGFSSLAQQLRPSIPFYLPC